eukprot:TRINITY_DN23923_c0_g3_i1.p1 TRINITY_DN23923_c0_g3~~TRINITY_DN23923_c0_g3_i1.p1  ORF type:complete len:576 (-),score=74.78 TRINITY_DN23923_c0_g3_i1:51-1559(-)
MSPEGRAICERIEAVLQRHHAALLEAADWSPLLEFDESASVAGTGEADNANHQSPPRNRVRRSVSSRALVQKSLTSLGGYVQRNKTRKAEQMSQNRQGLLRKFVKSAIFDKVSAAVLSANIVFMSVQVELTFWPVTPPSLQVVDLCFALFFMLELLLRLWAIPMRVFCCGENRSWNLFDAIVIGLSSIETATSSLVSGTGSTSAINNIGLIRIVRVVRVVRVLRVLRVLKFFKDVRILLMAVAHTITTAAWAFLLTFLCMYMFAIAITQMVADYVKEQQDLGNHIDRQSQLIVHFSSLPLALLTLFMSIAGGISWEVVVHALGTINPLAEVLFICYVLFTSFCMLNVIIGIFCKNAVEVLENDKEKMIELQLSEKTRYVDNLANMFNQWDTSGDGYITLKEFKDNIADSHMQAFLESMGVKPGDAVRLFEFMDREDGYQDGRVDLEGFVTGCLQLQGSAKALHMEQMYITLKLVEERVNSINQKVSELADLPKCGHGKVKNR